MMAKKILWFVFYMVLCVGLYNLFDFLWKTFITKSGYQFIFASNLFIPLTTGIVVWLVMFVFQNKKKK